MTDKRQHFVSEYCTNGHNASAAYHIAYPNCKVGWDRLGHRLMGYDEIKQAIFKKRAKLVEKVDYCYEKAHRLLAERLSWLDKAAQGGNIQAIQAQTAIIREMDDITGLHKQAIKTEVVTPVITEAEEEAYVAAAKTFKLRLATPQASQEAAG